MALSYSKIKSLSPRDKLHKVSDEGGLSIWIYPNGKKKWALAYRENGKQKTAYLGEYPAYSLAEAREWRDKIKERIAKSLPALEEERDEREYLFQNIYEKWFERWARTQKSPTNTNSRDRNFRRYLWSYYLDKDVRDIKPSHVIESLRPIESEGKLSTLTQMRGTLSLIFGYAIDSGLMDFNPVASISRTAFKKRKVNHFRALEPDKFSFLIERIEMGGMRPTTRMAIYWQMLTMTRPIETVTARWEDLDIENKRWNVPPEVMKKGRPHIVHLSSFALSLLPEIKELCGERSIYLFKGIGQVKHIARTSLRTALLNVGAETTAHGLRALTGTLLEEEGYSESVIKAALSHMKGSGDATTPAYLRSDFYKKRAEMLELIGEKTRAERAKYIK